MALVRCFTTVLSVLICCTIGLRLAESSSLMRVSCKNYSCIPGQECFLKNATCSSPPCPLIPSCRPSCQVIRCRSGTYCINGKCVTSCDEVQCGPGEQCVLENVACFTTPCPPFPTCKPDKCAVVRCRSGYECYDGQCVKKPTCDGFKCRPHEECYLQKVQCIRAPCFPVPTCRPLLTCATIKCKGGYICIDRKCIPEATCKGFYCNPGQECYLERKECITAPCPPPEPVCRASCALILCPAPSNCVNGQCIPITNQSKK